MKPDPEGAKIVEKLDQAIEALHQDVQKVEIWAGALSAFAHPVPAYRPSDAFVLPRPPQDLGDRPLPNQPSPRAED